MANGGVPYSDEEKKKYRELYAHLASIDPIINKFAKRHSIKISSINYKDCPERSLEWKNSNQLECLIQIYLNSDQKTFTIWLCASKDKKNKRYWKQIHKVEALLPPFDSTQLGKVLKESFAWLEDIEESELEFAVNIQSIPKI